MIVLFRVEKIATLRHVAFGPDPSDPLNSVPLGNVKEVTLELLPDARWGGKGSLSLQLNHDPGWAPGQQITVEFSTEA